MCPSLRVPEIEIPARPRCDAQNRAICIPRALPSPTLDLLPQLTTRYLIHPGRLLAKEPASSIRGNDGETPTIGRKVHVDGHIAVVRNFEAPSPRGGRRRQP